MCIQMAQVDKTIGRVMDELDARGIDYIVVLTADHGGLDAPERLQQQGYSLAGRLDDDLETENLAAAVSQATGVTAGQGPLLLGGAGMGDLYISRSLSEKDREAVTLALIARLRAHSQVAAVFTARQLESSPMPKGSAQDWSLQERVRASFNKDISGDLKVALKRGILPFKAKKGLVATHGSPWDYDRRVPIVFWRKGLSGFEQPAPVETVDIAPTLASLLGLNLPEGTFDGQCLDIDGSSANICRQ